MPLDQRFDELASEITVSTEPDLGRLERRLERRSHRRRTAAAIVAVAVVLAVGSSIVVWSKPTRESSTVAAVGPDTATSAPVGADDSPGGQAFGLCRKAAEPTNGRVAAAYPTTIAAAVALLPSVTPATSPPASPTSAPDWPEPLTGRPGDQFAANCQLSGTPNPPGWGYPPDQTGMESAVVNLDGQVLPVSFSPYPQNAGLVPSPGTAPTGTLSGSVITSGDPSDTPSRTAVGLAPIVTLHPTNDPTDAIGLEPDSQGQFALRLVPGTYEIQAAYASATGFTLACKASSPAVTLTVTVTADQTANVGLSCQIR